MVLQLTHPKKATSGFTLVELLAVIAIIIIILGAAGAALMPSNRSMDLSSASLQIKGLLDQGRQLALSRNCYVQVRFYAKTTEPTYYSAIGLFKADSPYYGDGTPGSYTQWMTPGGTTHLAAITPVAPIYYLSPSMALPTSGGATDFLTDLVADSTFHRQVSGDTINGQTDQYNWVAFYYMPNGATDFQTLTLNNVSTSYDPTRSYFTLVMRNDFVRGNNAPAIPANFFTFFLPPSTGRAVILRP